MGQGFFKRFSMKKFSLILILALLLSLTACNKAPAPLPGFGEECGLEIQSLDAYTGAYFEDGSGDAVENVMRLTVKNAGLTDYQLVQIILHDENGNSYSFKVTSLLHGETMVVLEENRAQYSSKLKFSSAELQNAVYFDGAPDMHVDAVAASAEDGAILLCNLTDEDLVNVYVYYKNYDGDVAQGGITYRVSAPILSPGETVEVPATHVSIDASRLIFVTYGA